jgi:hypothetical protein
VDECAALEWTSVRLSNRSGVLCVSSIPVAVEACVDLGCYKLSNSPSSE